MTLSKLLKAGDREQDLDVRIHPLIAGGRSEHILLGVPVMTVPPCIRYDPNSLGYHNPTKKASPEARSLAEVRSRGKIRQGAITWMVTGTVGQVSSIPGWGAKCCHVQHPAAAPRAPHAGAWRDGGGN